MPDLNIINVVVDKEGKPANYDAFTMAWKVLTQRFENTLSRRNFHGPVNQDERGMVFADHTDDKKLTQLFRQMRRYNPVPNQPSFGLGYRNLEGVREGSVVNAGRMAVGFWIQLPPPPKERRRSEQEMAAGTRLIHNLPLRNGCRNAWETFIR